MKAAAAGELIGNNDACCKLVTIARCSDKTTADAKSQPLEVLFVLVAAVFAAVDDDDDDVDK